MQIAAVIGVLIIAYLLGSIPFGWIVVKIATGRDIRGIESGRTGGTNAMRAAGFLAGFLTAVLDVLKAAASVWIVRWFIPDTTPFFHWIEVAAPTAAILGHNYSIYLVERHEHTGRMVLRGGAGGAACLGGAVGLWFPALYLALPFVVLIYVFVGYASVTTMSIALVTTVIFAIQASRDLLPWHYVIYGLIAEALLVWALRPNLERLRSGTERLHGVRAWWKKKKAEAK